jgi:RND family efflux transporter MFP subunit
MSETTTPTKPCDSELTGRPIKKRFLHPRFVSIPLALALLVATAALWAWPSAPRRSPPPKPAGLVKTHIVDAGNSAQPLRIAGVTRAKKHAVLSFTVPARLRSQNVRAGQRVKKGELLATLDPAQFQLGLSAANAALAEVDARLAQARRDLERVQDLHKAGALPSGQLEHAKALVDGLDAGRNAAIAQQRDARRLLSETTLRAPFDGTVTAIGLQPGEVAAPGHPIIELSGDGPVQLEVELPESIARSVHTDMAVKVLLPFAEQRTVPGKVVAIAHAAVGPGRLFSATVDIDTNQQVSAGMTAELMLDVHSGDTLLVPLRAVLNPGGSRPFVFRVRDGSAQRVDVQLDGLVGSDVAVRGELQRGDRLVIAGHTSLADGDEVREVSQ